MRVKPVLFFMLFWAACSVGWANRDDEMEPAEYFFIPKGDPQSGRKAFEELKCTACHQTADQAGKNMPIAAKRGPVLGPQQAAYPTGWIANSVVSPSHTIALNSDGQADEGHLSRMGDFSEIMTVRQMIDLVAYIQSLREEDTPQPRS